MKKLILASLLFTGVSAEAQSFRGCDEFNSQDGSTHFLTCKPNGRSDILSIDLCEKRDFYDRRRKLVEIYLTTAEGTGQPMGCHKKDCVKNGRINIELGPMEYWVAYFEHDERRPGRSRFRAYSIADYLKEDPKDQGRELMKDIELTCTQPEEIVD